MPANNLCGWPSALAVACSLGLACTLALCTTAEELGAQDGGAEGRGASQTQGLSFRDVAGFLVGILAGALMMLLSSYMRWRSERLEQEAAAARQQPLLAPLHPHPQLLVPALARSQKGASGGESTDPASSADTPRLGLPALVQPAQSGSLPSTVAGATSSGGSGTVLSEGSDGLPRRPTSELRMLEEFVLSLVKRGSNQESKSSTGGSHASAGQLGAPASLSLVQGADVLSPHPKTTDLAKLPSGFADVLPGDLTLIDVIGEGSFGEVWRANYCSTTVAVKILTQIKVTNLTASLQQQHMLQSLRKEAEMMSKLVHPNICRYLGACLNPPLIVLEYCSRRSLDTLLAAGLRDPKVRKELTWDRLLQMVTEAATGIRYLHTRQPAVAHRDIKSSNLLVDETWHVRVADFNLSRPVEDHRAASTVLMTNPRWLAPCVLSGLPGQLAADVWSFGTVMWEVMSWTLPFEDLNPFQIISVVRDRGTESLQAPPNDQLPAGPMLPENYEAYVQLMRDCRAANPEGRPCFTEIVARLRPIVDREVAARRPDVPAPPPQPDVPQSIVSFRLPPEGPAVKKALADLQRRRTAMFKGSSGSGSTSSGGSGSGSGSGGSGSGSGGGGGGSGMAKLSDMPALDPVAVAAAKTRSSLESNTSAALPPSPTPADAATIGKT